MSEEFDALTPTPDTSKSEKVKPVAVRHAQIEQAKARLERTSSHGENANPIVDDETYGGLHEQNRVVMRHQIALNIENFRAAPDDFTPRPVREYPPLAVTAPPFFSVIIPNFNGMRFLPPLLTALAQQSFRDFEIIIADDASRDESVAWVEANYPAVRLLVNRRNQGFVASCNTAADAARGRLLVLLNSDTEPEPGWLAELAQVVCANPRAAMIASKMLLFDKRDTLHTTGDQMGADGIPRNRGVWETDHGQYDKTPTVLGGCGGGTAYRKDVWEQLGGFDADFWMYVEDADFAFRANYWVGKRSLRPKPGSITISAPQAATPCPASTSVVTPSGTSPRTCRAACCCATRLPSWPLNLRSPWTRCATCAAKRPALV
ncbi:MAG: glycosyltransferase family 2 protein [Caldilineaceae bacterium]|nr:glycosyltransferase family 2 protein [Caldilineaceae bacterium]